jgi:hypothetical protein
MSAGIKLDRAAGVGKQQALQCGAQRERERVRSEAKADQQQTRITRPMATPDVPTRRRLHRPFVPVSSTHVSISIEEPTNLINYSISIPRALHRLPYPAELDRSAYSYWQIS